VFIALPLGLVRSGCIGITAPDAHFLLCMSGNSSNMQWLPCERYCLSP